MRFRLPDWDVEMPAALVDYWTAWNADDLDAVPGLLARAVTADVEWNDPRDSFVGIAELEAAVRRLRTSKPEYRFEIVSEIDHHRGRVRYRWNMVRRGRVLMEGHDVATLDRPEGPITLTATRRSTVFTLSVADQGCWDPTPSRSPGGFGLHIIRTLARDTSLTSTGEGTTLTVRLHRAPPAYRAGVA